MGAHSGRSGAITEPAPNVGMLGTTEGRWAKDTTWGEAYRPPSRSAWITTDGPVAVVRVEGGSSMPISGSVSASVLIMILAGAFGGAAAGLIVSSLVSSVAVAALVAAFVAGVLAMIVGPLILGDAARVSRSSVGLCNLVIASLIGALAGHELAVDISSPPVSTLIGALSGVIASILIASSLITVLWARNQLGNG